MKYISMILSIAMLAISAVADENISAAVGNGSNSTTPFKWLESCYAEILTIKPGMERKDLDPLFTPDGGISFRMAQTFLYKKAPIIKIHVIFHLPNNGDIDPPYGPHDLIESISFPFLAYPD